MTAPHFQVLRVRDPALVGIKASTCLLTRIGSVSVTSLVTDTVVSADSGTVNFEIFDVTLPWFLQT